ncbi:MAG: DUF349 domain-containing protein [Paramuribaculum sp.]|nr:DUF349 domain-containing protein [Paramuribaculum sp.]
MELLNNDANALHEPNASSLSADNAAVEVSIELTADMPGEIIAEQQEVFVPSSATAVIERLQSLVQGSDCDIDSDELASLKQQFYSLRNDAVYASRQAFIDAGGEVEAYTPDAELVEQENQFKALLAEAKEKKAAARARIEAQQLENLKRKQAIIAELTAMSEDADNVNRHYPQAKELQTEFKEIGDVPPQNATETWKAYQDAVEKFYDQWKVNKELRDYDFKKNLAEKQLIIAEAEALAGEEDIITAFRRLQDLHEKWRQSGPVAKELRESLWAQFKDASAGINKRYQDFFEQRKLREQQNEEAKTALCEKAEAIDIDALTSFSAWNEATRTLLDLQQQWKTLGFASRKANNALFSRFRAVADKFFQAKATFFSTVKDTLSENLAKKISLVEQAESLSASTEWRKTTDILVKLQQEWKTIGAVPKKHSDALWHRFNEACDKFFAAKKAATGDQRKTEAANLKVKRQILNELTAMLADDCDKTREEAVARIQELRTQWQGTGHVPFRDKDKLAESYRNTMRELFERYDIHGNQARMQAYQSEIDSMTDSDRPRLVRERERMVRAYEARKAELKTYENNLSFLSAKSRSGNSLISDIQSNIHRLQATLTDLEKKIEIIDSKL